MGGRATSRRLDKTVTSCTAVTEDMPIDHSDGASAPSLKCCRGRNSAITESTTLRAVSGSGSGSGTTLTLLVLESFRLRRRRIGVEVRLTILPEDKPSARVPVAAAAVAVA